MNTFFALVVYFVTMIMSSSVVINFITSFITSFVPNNQTVSNTIELVKLLYTTNISRLVMLFVPPIFAVIFAQINYKVYDHDKLSVTQSFYFVGTNILMTFFMNGLSGMFVWYLTDYRIRELEFEFEELKITTGTFLPTGNKKRIAKALKNIWQISQIYHVPLSIYKSIISISGSIYMIEKMYYKIGLLVIYATTMYIIHMFVGYTTKTTVVETVFDSTTKDGYIEEKTKEQLNPKNIIKLGDATEVYSRLAIGHTVVNDINSQMETHTKRSLKNLFKSTLVDTAGSIIFIVLLNVSSRSVAQSASSLCWMISCAFESIHKWKKIYYLQEHMHILTKLKLNKHQCAVKQVDASERLVDSIALDSVSFKYDSDILIDGVNEPIDALRNLSCRFSKGRLNYITGPNGQGKSTIFKALMYNISNGSIKFDDTCRDALDWFTLRSMVYQLNQSNENPALLSDEIISQLKSDNINLAKQFELDDLSNVSSDKQGGSGGQEQRIHIFTALASGTPVVLLDEPFSALDIEWKDKIEDILIEQAKTKIIIMIGHNCFSDKRHHVNSVEITHYSKSTTGNTELITCID
jgi:ABC-type bacteriocin/lantibiotic exporter with double-glycine peptidase domain